MALRLPTDDDLRDMAALNYLELTDEEVEEFQSLMPGMFELYDDLDQAADRVLLPADALDQLDHRRGSSRIGTGIGHQAHRSGAEDGAIPQRAARTVGMVCALDRIGSATRREEQAWSDFETSPLSARRRTRLGRAISS